MTLIYPQTSPGFEMHDLLESRKFSERAPKGNSEPRRLLALQIIAEKFFTTPEEMLQRLVEAATDFCGADSAGVSLEEPDGSGGFRFRWVAVAGSFERYRNGVTPRNFSPCGVCVDRWRAQSYTVSEPYYDFLGVTAEPILDGMLIPWASDCARGTIWAVSHKSALAFDQNDYLILQQLAHLVTVAIRHQKN